MHIISIVLRAMLIGFVIFNISPGDTPIDGPLILPADGLSNAGNVISNYFDNGYEEENLLRMEFAFFMFDDFLNYTPPFNNSSFLIIVSY